MKVWNRLDVESSTVLALEEQKSQHATFFSCKKYNLSKLRKISVFMLNSKSGKAIKYSRLC